MSASPVSLHPFSGILSNSSQAHGRAPSVPAAWLTHAPWQLWWLMMQTGDVVEELHIGVRSGMVLFQLGPGVAPAPIPSRGAPRLLPPSRLHRRSMAAVPRGGAHTWSISRCLPLLAKVGASGSHGCQRFPCSLLSPSQAGSPLVEKGPLVPVHKGL